MHTQGESENLGQMPDGMQRCWRRACKGRREYEYEYMCCKLDLTITGNGSVVPSAVYCGLGAEGATEMLHCLSSYQIGPSAARGNASSTS